MLFQPAPATLRFLSPSLTHTQVLCNNLLFLMGIILVNYGVEEGLNYYLDDWGALGSFACILVGGGILLYIRINKVPVAQSIMRGFWGG